MDTNNLDNSGSSDVPSLASSSVAAMSQQYPRKKRTNSLWIDTSSQPSSCTSKPKPTDIKIVRPCTECGKKFQSWKALFGHMRCHPERNWRGINPPETTSTQAAEDSSSFSSSLTEEEHEVAACLLMLASGPTIAAAAATDHESPSACTVNQETPPEDSDSGRDAEANVDVVDIGVGLSCRRFECTSCRKVFDSSDPQAAALGGRRASHKHVNTKNDDGRVLEEGFCVGRGQDEVIMKESSNCDKNILGQNLCSTCMRVFSSSGGDDEAMLGGHKKGQWENKVEDQPSASGHVSPSLDLNNCPVPLVEDDDEYASSSNSSGRPALELRLGL